ATRFDFDHFICKDSGGPKTKPDKGDKEPKTKDDDDVKAPKGTTTQSKTGAKGKAQPRASGPADFLPPPEEKKAPSEWKIKREALEKQFLAVEGSLDVPERQALWPELAVANTGEGSLPEAAICWLNALWDTEPPPADWLAAWVRAEFPGIERTVRAEDFDARLHSKTPGVSDHRAVIAGFLWVSSQHPVPPWLTARLPAIQKYLETHDTSIQVRGAWLAAYRLAQLAGSDVLGLARVRDRLLQRLLDGGLSPERDIPNFLRNAGSKDSDRLREVRE